MKNKCVIESVNASLKDCETGIYWLQNLEDQFPDLLTKLLAERLVIEEVPRLDFAKVHIKAILDLVPPVSKLKRH